MQSHGEIGRPDAMRRRLTVVRRTLRGWSMVALIGLVLSNLDPGTAVGQAVNSPPKDPISMMVFPPRDFVSASGYASDDQVIVRVMHAPLLFPGAAGGTTDSSQGPARR